MNKTTQDMSTTEKRKEIVASLREGFAALPLDIEVWLDEQESNPCKQYPPQTNKNNTRYEQN